jgi:hypothetical protein
MRFISLPIQFSEKKYELNPIFGLLLQTDKNYPNKNVVVPEKIIEALAICMNPYSLTKPKLEIKKKSSHINKLILRLYYNLLINVSKYNFGLGTFCSNIGQPVFDNASDSILFFRNEKPGTIQNNLCLSRSIFAASTSKLFKDKGVIFIGVLLPTTLMHAWIIEDSKQPDQSDNMWINFQPVAALY